MKSSGTSSAKASSPFSEPLTREGFALTGPSTPLDPAVYAVRGDLADVRLADRVFAPHYAAPMVFVVTRPVDLRAARERGSAVVGTLAAGDVFEALELTDDTAWGVAPGRSRVGYVDRTSLDRPGPDRAGG